MNSIDICNLALGMLGMPRITSFEETNNNAKLCRDFFPILRDRILRDHFWSFAVSVTPLAAIDDVSPFPDFPAIYALPADTLRVISLADDSDYVLFSNQLYTAAENPSLVYVRKVEDPEEFDSSFSACLQYLLAAEIGAANTRDRSLIDYYLAQYNHLLTQAKANDSQENVFANQPPPRRNTFLASRSGKFTSSRFAPVKKTKGTAGRA